MPDRDKLLKQIEELEEADKAKNAFIANISHEVRTPMNAILGFAELILQQDTSDTVNSYAQDIKNASNNLLAIINDLLDISKIESGKMELSLVPYFVKYLFSDVESVISIPIQKKGLSFKSSIDPEMPSQMHGDIVRIRQILINLVNNAVKFTREGYVAFGATFEEGITTGRLSEEELRKISDDGEDYITYVFTVRDTGIGIKPEDMHKIFDKFQQVDSRMNRGIEGTGLGLSISRQLIDMMHGSISVESTYGEGTCFTVKIPQKVLDRRKLSKFMVSGQSEEKKSRKFYAPDAKILVVDDNAINLKIMNGLLMHYQIEPQLCESGVQAIEAVKEKDYDLIFMDHMMPEMDGVEATGRIRALEDEKKKNVNIIAVSANAIRGVAQQFTNQGFMDYLSKPIELARLEYLLRKFLPGNLIVEENDSENDSIQMPDIEIKGIDINAGLAKCDYSVRDYFEILGFVRDLGEDKCRELERLIADENFADYTISVHALKSVAENIGAHRLHTMARINEMAGKEGRNDFLLMNHEKLISMYRDIIGNIGEALDKIGDLN